MTETYDPTTPRDGRLLMTLSSGFLIAFGVVAMLVPSAIAPIVEIEVSSATALADFRAMYGGIPLAIGVLLVLGLRRASWYLPSLFLLTLTCAEAAGARIYSTLVSGIPSNTILVFAALELLGCGVGFLSYRRLTRKRVQPIARAAHA